MENFAFHQFLRQIYTVHPELQEHDELVRSFITDALVDKKSLVIDEHVLSILRTYIQKRTSLQQVGDDLLPASAMLFASEEILAQDRGTASEESRGDVSQESVSHDDEKYNEDPSSVHVSGPSSSSFSFFWFLSGVFVGALLLLVCVLIYASSQDLL